MGRTRSAGPRSASDPWLRATDLSGVAHAGASMNARGASGWLRAAHRLPSPNADERPAGTVIDTVVIHHISLPPEHYSGRAVLDLFANTLDCDAHPAFDALRGLRVSSHFLIRRHGELLQFVDADRRAWHAGVSRLFDRERCNDFSIGIELEGGLLRPFTQSQYRRLAGVLDALARRYPLRWVVGHSDIAPGRKVDPGPMFRWDRLSALLESHGLARPFDEAGRLRAGEAEPTIG